MTSAIRWGTHDAAGLSTGGPSSALPPDRLGRTPRRTVLHPKNEFSGRNRTLPTRGEARFRGGLAHARIVKSSDAPDLSRAIEDDPLNPNNHHNLGLMHWLTGRVTEGETPIRRALKLSPHAAGRTVESDAALKTLIDEHDDQAAFQVEDGIRGLIPVVPQWVAGAAQALLNAGPPSSTKS